MIAYGLFATTFSREVWVHAGFTRALLPLYAFGGIVTVAALHRRRVRGDECRRGTTTPVDRDDRASCIATAVNTVGPSTAHRVILALGIVLLSLGACTTLTEDRSIATDPFAFDFNVNWVAAQRLVDHEALYDAAASRVEAIRDVSPRMRFFYDSPFDSYIGPPVTALVHAPLLLFDHDTALVLFRLLALVGMVLAIFAHCEHARRAGIGFPPPSSASARCCSSPGPSGPSSSGRATSS